MDGVPYGERCLYLFVGDALLGVPSPCLRNLDVSFLFSSQHSLRIRYLYSEALLRTVDAILFDETLVQRYAKKIMGFAYLKTQNITLAEDLSQEILLSLADSLRRQDDIRDMDGFVYTICCHTWSKYLRGNKKHWKNLDLDTMVDLHDACSVEADVAQALLIDRLKTEIAYLTKLHRQITLMFYYENKTGDEISRILKIPHSTVRWHLGEIKKKLKVGIEMNGNLSYTPRRITAGHDGHTSIYGHCGLGEDRLVDNICLACYGEALTLEEIARKLSVATAYLEHHLERLVYMDYMRVVDKSKYMTAFFIAELRHDVFAGKYHYHHIGPIALKIFQAFAKQYDRIRAIGFLGSDQDKDFVLWALLPLIMTGVYHKALENVLTKRKLKTERP